MAEVVKNNILNPVEGHAGIKSQVPGAPATVSATAGATGGIAPGHLVESDIDAELFAFQSEDTALMTIMGHAKSVKVSSPIVEHFMIDEQRSVITLTGAVAATDGQAVLPLAPKDQTLVRGYSTLIVQGVDGYDDKGEKTPGKWLMLFATGERTGDNPMVRAVNGPKPANSADSVLRGMPAIPAGTKLSIMANALYETQKEVDPTLIVPKPRQVILQKRGMNQLVSDYFDAQKKHIPFAKALLAEQAILNFKREGNRTLWMGRPGVIPVNVPKLGVQDVYMTEGIRWQFLRELQITGKWTFEKFIALMKMFYTGEDVPKSCIMLAGKNLLEEIQCINFKEHPEVQVCAYNNGKFGWDVTRIHTVFGDVDIKREPTLDTLGLSNSGALIGEDRLVHYTYSTQHEFSDRVDGQEATRTGILVWDALALKGGCHIWLDGEGNAANAGAVVYQIWDSDQKPDDADLVKGTVYYLLQDVPAMGPTAQNGTMWQVVEQGGKLGFEEFTGNIMALGD